MAARLAAASAQTRSGVGAAPATGDSRDQTPVPEQPVPEQLLLSDRLRVPDVGELRTLAAAELQRHEAEAEAAADRVYELTLDFAAVQSAAASGQEASVAQETASPSRWAARLGRVLGGLQTK